MAVEVRSSTQFEWVIVPGIVPWDTQAGEAANPMLANVPIRFALVKAGTADPAEDDYRPGEWRAEAGGKFSGRFSVGSAGAVHLPGPGVFDIFCAIDGVQSKPRRKVGQLVVA